MEPQATALVLLISGVLVAGAVLFGRIAGRTGVPVLLIFLVVGMLAGQGGLPGLELHDPALAYRLGTAALVLILFDGGFQTPIDNLRRALAPAGALATLGVLGTAGVVALVARATGLDWGPALLLGAMVSSTDAAAVFSVLRGSGLQLRRRAGTTLEVESGINDPMAVILTTVLAGTMLTPGEGPGPWSVAWMVTWQTAVQMAIGTAGGLGVGWLARWILGRVHFGAGLGAVFTLAVAGVAYGLTSLLWGSGFLAVYLAGLVLGNAELPYRNSLLRVHEAIGWMSQVVMFLILGLLAVPQQLLAVIVPGVTIGLVLALVARPLVVGLILAPFGYPAREIGFIGWVGLRGAVPIVLATVPLMLGLPAADRLFDLVFVIVVVSALVPGATVAWITRRLRMASNAPQPPRATVEVNAAGPLAGQFTTWHVHPLSPVAETALRDIPLPAECSVVLLVRGDEVLAARGTTLLHPGDHVTLYHRAEDRPFLVLCFGQQEEEY